MTEYHPNHLQKGFMSTMTNLYYESNSGSLLPPDLYRFSPIIGYALVILFDRAQLLSIPPTFANTHVLSLLSLFLPLQSCIFLTHRQLLQSRTPFGEHLGAFQINFLGSIFSKICFMYFIRSAKITGFQLIW